ncbi:site-specific integrase [Abyssalbus ytuae]|uniref:Site-specific integrase n=1 Tax=Abyssalbus ytuae TaxID=2926907 RepID=A0A9E6ZXD8_9FLAO|nr:site-specific integrase [Abyssalbus ytuae]UOB19498.1 site-specific integrase [Abyssalbus ytuae]
MKTDYLRTDKTAALYLQLYQNKKIIRIPLNISVPPGFFDKKSRRIKKGFKLYKEYNLIIEKKLAEVNKIEVHYKLSGQHLTIKKLCDELENHGLRINFNTFADLKLKQQKDFLKSSTYRQQKGCLSKIKKYMDPLLFRDIDETFLNNFRFHLKNKLKNKNSTIESTLKNFKKYLHLANNEGIKTSLNFTDIKIKSMKGEMTFLTPEELKDLYNFYRGPINTTWKNILQRYLFSCFTGLRISDIETIKEENFINDFLVFTMVKTEKFIKIKLNKTSLSLVEFPNIFRNNYSREHINRELKLIAKAVGINKNISYHTSRHTFATNFLISGGSIRNLKKILGHSKIETTMIYVHEVQNILNEEISLMDNIINKD